MSTSLLSKDDFRAHEDDSGVVSITLGDKILCQYTKEQDGRCVLGFLDASVAEPMRRISWYPSEYAIVDQLGAVLSHG